MEVIVFTNGCFDIIHPGHIDLLRRARKLGTKLIVGINSDRSVKAIKGDNKPYLNQNDRSQILKGIKYVDDVFVFDEQTPEKLIKKIKPDVLVKGGDWAINEIIGSDYVLKRGGKVFSLPLKGNYSSSSIVEKIKANNLKKEKKSNNESSRTRLIENSLRQHLDVFQKLLKNDIEKVESAAKLIIETFAGGNKILICGNGGSAADAQHIAAEFVGRFETERKALPAIALTTDTSVLTALANDYNFEQVFSRQIEALGQKGDLLIAISTSGNSPNVISAVMTARRIGCKILGMTGASCKKLASLSDECLKISSPRTARIQEAHITIAHIWCEIIDAENNKQLKSRLKPK
jgi:D-sedoheptulose 7-phosphate isomerase